MTLSSLIILLSIGLISFQFWRLRGIAEHCIAFAKQYCDNNNLQFISLARQSTKFTIYKGKLDWKISYTLEFSSNGEDAYEGKLVSIGKHIASVELPVYKIN
ncbi:DUF3301 domain-containing protein [Glaciecola sp. KUL10]|uniref:DUF3301 domain-containing protein n=1 Tax=Glaciecola sp. (strain KUL10) TaxID=2161813 RepID=UPI000D789384|nr:DUF3301 domain-containing protein [Glaciecola sp. KUL10]GBL04142.1 hypothetical protein KUL10_14480 [Glaciecola sp. KUL10]